jgi:5-methylcytosine-specific restriction endonuclease McrA
VADTIDHVVPRSRGGGHTWENCVAACRMCNSKKADRLLGELGWTLERPPAPAQPQRRRGARARRRTAPRMGAVVGGGGLIRYGSVPPSETELR